MAHPLAIAINVSRRHFIADGLVPHTPIAAKSTVLPQECLSIDTIKCGLTPGRTPAPISRDCFKQIQIKPGQSQAVFSDENGIA